MATNPDKPVPPSAAPSVFLYLASLQVVQKPEIPPWPLRIIWRRVFEPLGPGFQVMRAPSLNEAQSMSCDDWERWNPYPVSRLYFPRTQRRWQRIRDAIMKRRGCMP